MDILNGINVSGRVSVTRTTEQVRIGYDGSNYTTITVGSSGLVTFNATSGIHIFSQTLIATDVQADRRMKILDSAGLGNYYLLIESANIAATADRTLFINLNNVNRTLEFTGNATLSGTNTGDQLVYRNFKIGATTRTADTTNDTFEFIAGTNITLSTSGDNITINAASGGATTFLGLTDTPSSYSGQANKIVRVNGGASALEFVDAPAASNMNAVENSGGNTVAIATTETTLGSVTITPQNSGTKIHVFARLNCLKDSGTTVRTVTMRIKRGSTQVGRDSVIRSQGVATTDFGPAVVSDIDSHGQSGAITYNLVALSSAASTATAKDWEIYAVELIGAKGDTGPAGTIADGDKGDITVSSSGTVWTIDNGAVTNAKLANSSITINGTSVSLGSSISVGTVTGTGAANKVAIWSSSTALTSDTNLHWDTTNDRLGIKTATPTTSLQVAGGAHVTKELACGLFNWEGDAFEGRIMMSGSGSEFSMFDRGLTTRQNSAAGDRFTLYNSSKLFRIYTDVNNDIFTMTNTGAIGLNISGGGFGGTPAAQLHVLASTEQLRLAHASTTFTSFTVASTGELTIAPRVSTSTKHNVRIDSERFGLYNVTPVSRATTAIGGATFTANTGTTVNSASTFDGYTIAQVVKALRDIGVLT